MFSDYCGHLMSRADKDSVKAWQQRAMPVGTSYLPKCVEGWGYEKGEHYDVSMKGGERVLLPAVRGADKDALIISDGFSCRSQITEATDRRALHLAQVIQIALHDGDGAANDYPESDTLRGETVTAKPARCHAAGRGGHANRRCPGVGCEEGDDLASSDLSGPQNHL